MHILTPSPKLAAQLGAGVVLGLILFLVMGSDYSHGLAGGEENISSQLEHNLQLAGIPYANSAKQSSSRTLATKRPTVKLKATQPVSQTVAENSKKVPQITVTKSGGGPTFDRKASKANWRFLDRSVRAKIDAAKVTPSRWKMIVIHSSATKLGSAKAFDYYHRQVKHMKHGLAYHFVIGNGNGSSDGKIEVGPRWSNQDPGGHLRSDAQNEIALGICLVGSFEKGNPTPKQIEALDELIDYLQAKLGKIKVTTHRLVNIRPTLCPGKHFPATQFVEP